MCQKRTLAIVNCFQITAMPFSGRSVKRHSVELNKKGGITPPLLKKCYQLLIFRHHIWVKPNAKTALMPPPTHIETPPVVAKKNTAKPTSGINAINHAIVAQTFCEVVAC